MRFDYTGWFGEGFGSESVCAYVLVLIGFNRKLCIYRGSIDASPRTTLIRFCTNNETSVSYSSNFLLLISLHALTASRIICQKLVNITIFIQM